MIILEFLFSWYFFALFVFLCVLTEFNDSPFWPALWGVLSSVILYKLLNIETHYVVPFGIGYISFGIVWSLYRYKRYVEHEVSCAGNKMDGYTKAALHPSKNVHRIVTWMLVWPISLINNILGDVWNFMGKLVTKYLKSAYLSVYNKALGQDRDTKV